MYWGASALKGTLNIPSIFAAASIIPGRLFFPVSSRSSRSRISMLGAMRFGERKEEGLNAGGCVDGLIGMMQR